MKSVRGLFCLAAAFVATGASATPPVPQPAPQKVGGELRERPDETPEILRALASGETDPAGDAARAAGQGDFRFVYSAFGRGGHGRPVGVICHTAYQMTPGMRAIADWGDSIDVDAVPSKQQYEAYATTFNRTMVDHPAFPHADICEPVEWNDRRVFEWSGNYVLLGRPTRGLTRIPLTLHEAARRGSAAQVQAFLRRQNIDDLDVFGMTALSWAVAHGRDDIVTVLLEAGASPTPMNASAESVSPVLAAITQSRVALLIRLAPPGPLHAGYLDEAIRSGDPAMVRTVFSMPHQAPTLSWHVAPSPSAEVAAIAIEYEGKRAADAFLAVGADKGRLDLVRLAVEGGADVNAYSARGETPLLAALGEYGPEIPAIVDVLLAAGADPNKRVEAGNGYDTAFWRAFHRATGSRSLGPELLERLARAGGDAGVEWWPKTPSAWTVVFPYRGDLTQVDAPPVETLRLLQGAGLDLNAPYQDRCLLDAVEAATGPDGQTARDLRTLGAKRRSPSGECSRRP